MYASHGAVGSLADFRNLSFLLPRHFNFHPPMQIPPTVIFHDDIKECSNAARFVENLLLIPLRTLGLVKHYHGLMSPEYLERTYQEFQAGQCQILHTCPGMELVNHLLHYSQPQLTLFSCRESRNAMSSPMESAATVQRGFSEVAALGGTLPMKHCLS
jgi:hypothetical protein